MTQFVVVQYLSSHHNNQKNKAMNYNTTFDRDIISKFEHFKKHPQLLPFIGREWNESPHKVLLVAESHYLPQEFNNQYGLKEWNDLDLSKSLDDNRAGYTNTRDNAYSPSHAIHKVIFKSFNNVFRYQKHRDAYDKISFYNYFQRPAEQNGESIHNLKEDDQLAYEFFQEFRRIIQPSWTFFLSKKSFNAYRKSGGTLDRVSAVPHPNSSWWNTKSKNHSDRTGKEKFEQILTKAFITKEI